MHTFCSLLTKFLSTKSVQTKFVAPQKPLKDTSGRKNNATLKSKSVKNARKRAITDLNAPNGSRDISFQSQEIWARWTSPFCRFSASFSLKYDVTDAILQDNEKMKVEYLRSLLFDLFETLQSVRTW